MAYQDPPDTEDVPGTPEDYRVQFFAEVRHIRRMAENVFWVLLTFAVIVALGFGWLLHQAAQ